MTNHSMGQKSRRAAQAVRPESKSFAQLAAEMGPANHPRTSFKPAKSDLQQWADVIAGMAVRNNVPYCNLAEAALRDIAKVASDRYPHPPAMMQAIAVIVLDYLSRRLSERA